MKKLILWDIDGTLVDAGGAGVRALLGAMKACFNIEVSADGIEMAGRTDLDIIDEMFGVYRAGSDAGDLQRCLEYYHGILETEMANGDTCVFPGVESVLHEIRGREEIEQAILTGNTRVAARVKLDHFSIRHFFAFGAYGDESKDRNALAELALRRAREGTGGTMDPRNIFVIGDTVRDVACGKAIGAHTVAVATGFCSAGELAACEPTTVLEDLADPAAFFAVIDAV